MASRSNRRSQATGDSDALEVLKPLLVLALFAMILYGAYSVVQKGPRGPETSLDDAPPFAPPNVEFASLSAGASASPPAMSAPAPVGAATPLPTAAFPPPAAQAPAGPTPAPAAAPLAPAPVATDATATFLPAQSAPPPVAESAGPRAGDDPLRPDRYAALPTGPLPPGLFAGAAVDAAQPPMVKPDPSLPLAPSAAFTSAWADAHDKLAAGRHAEALAALSIWYDDPALGLEESQRLEDLLGQLAGTVIYSQRDLLLPPRVVAPGDTLPAIAAALAVPWPLLAKINGIDDPLRLHPGEHLKLVRGPFDATVSVSRRRLTLHVGGNYAGRFSVVVGRQFLDRVGGSFAVSEVRREPATDLATTAPRPRAILLEGGLLIEPADDPAALSDTVAGTSLVTADRDFAELVDILGPGSRVLVRQ
jgi:hypothetical protein